MLRGLRRKFVVIVMVLVGGVLVAMLGSTYAATYQAQRRIIDESLERGVHNDTGERPMMGGSRARERGGLGGMLGLVVEVSDEGVVLEVSDDPVSIDAAVLEGVISSVLVEGRDAGADRTAHIEWRSVSLEGGGSRIAIIDTTSSEAFLREQAIKDLQITFVALATLLAITWWLSDWALRPVERAWEQQRRFVADASHELKTPIAVILANTQILERDEGIGDDAMRWVRSTSGEAQHMRELVGDLLQLARADEALMGGGATPALRREEVNLSELVEAVSLEFDAVAFERGCSLRCEVAEGVRMRGDPEWMGRLVRILVDNACKYGADGTEVSVRLDRSGARATLAVHNAGNPIDPSDLPHVFERFYRSDKARSREGTGGFGLGLAIAKGIADAHGAVISVSSTAEGGTTFTVSIRSGV